jgi:hypothetical protein
MPAPFLKAVCLQAVFFRLDFPNSLAFEARITPQSFYSYINSIVIIYTFYVVT